MALYRYAALDKEGKKLAGFIDADTIEKAKDRLRASGVILTRIIQAKKQAEISIGSTNLIHFTRDIAQLLSSKLPLYESLLTIEEKYRTHKFHYLFLDLCDKVKQGKALSEAMALFPSSFDRVYISMVRAGENTGKIDEAFLELYKVIARTEKFKKQVNSALFYPFFLLCFCLLILTGLFLFLIPSMKELLEGRVLHPMTEIILGISNWLVENGNWFFPGIITSVIAAVLSLRLRVVKDFFHKMLTEIPLVRTIFTEAILMRFCRVLSILLKSGVPIVEAIEYAKGVIHHKEFEKVMEEAEKGLVKGSKFSEEIKKSPLIPSMVIRMIETSEETGRTSEMLLSISEIYEEMLEKTISQFTNLLQPVMLLIIGLLVGVVLLAVLLPLTDVSTMI
jgi:general secretion pathway protein F/type IV pilus assembly protein PilC